MASKESRRIRSRMKAALERARIWGENIAGFRKNKANRYTPPDEELQRQRLIGSMTNWQRNQAGRKCKGNWSRLSIYDLQHYANLPHWKKAA